MLHVLKPYNCPSCKLVFTGKDGYRISATHRFPLLLQCGHTLCENCINAAYKSQRSVNCAVCQKPTNFEINTPPLAKLLPDVYALGIASANVKQTMPSLKNKLVPAIPSKEESHNNTAIVCCEICSMRPASFRCKKCEENFCNICFDSSHKNSKKLKNHVAIPVYAEVYHTLVQEGCPDHENRPIEFFCEEDNRLTCSHCVITGSHKGHHVVTLVEKNNMCAEDLKAVYEEVSMFSKRLQFTEEKLAQAIPNEKIDCSQWVKDIHAHFHELHSALFIRENELLQQIEDIANASTSHITKLRQEVSDTSKDVEALLRDAACAMENPTLSVSVPAIINKMEAVKNAPCHLIPIGGDDSSNKIDLSFDGDLQKKITQHGKITAELRPKYCLRRSDDLPPSFAVEPLPHDIANTGDTESLSEAFSDDSLCTSASNFDSLESHSKHYGYPSSANIERVTVCHIVDPTCFYIRKCSDVSKLNDITSKIGKWVRNEEYNATKPPKDRSYYIRGNVYLVRFTNDNKWYRGRILEIIESSTPPVENLVNGNGDVPVNKNMTANSELKAEVYYIDYGNSEIVPIERVRPIGKDLLRYPGLAKKCSLHDIQPINNKEWTLEAKTEFQNFVFNKEVNMHVIEEVGGVLYVDLCQTHTPDMIVMDVPASVRDALIFLEHGCFYDENELTKVKRVRKFRQFLPPERICAGSRVSVNITHIENPSSFYVQQLSSSRFLSELIMAMQKEYSAETNILHNIVVPYVGMICAAQFQQDKMWYRAEVLSLPGGAQVEIDFVDFGYKQVVHHRYLRQITDKFTKLNRQAIPCTLADISFSYGVGWSEECKTWLLEYTKQKRFTLLSLGYEQNSTKTKAVLYDLENGIETCINALMVERGMAISTGVYSTIVQKRKEKHKSKPKKSPSSVPETTSFSSFEGKIDSPIMNGVNAFSQPCKEPIRPKSTEKLSDYVKVIMSHIESPGSFYVRIAGGEEEKNLEKLMDEMQDTYSKMDGSILDVKPAGDFAALRESDKRWYRVIIQSLVDDETVKVRFPDYGYMDKVPKKNLRPLLPKYETDKSYAIRCYLSGVTPAGDSNCKWSQVAIDLFTEIVTPYSVLFLVNGITDSTTLDQNSLPSDLYFEEVTRGGALEPSTVNYRSITEMLVERGVAIPIRKRMKCIQPNTADFPYVGDTVSVADTADQLLESSPESCPKLQKPREPSFKWKPAELPAMPKFTALPTQVGHDGRIYLQISPDAIDKADMIKQALQCKYDGLPFNPLRIAPPIGEACVAEFELDKKYYRAEIIKNDPNNLKVQFVDYGNYEKVSLAKIHTDPPLKDIPRLCIECDLVDVNPPSGTWPSNVLDFMHEKIVERLCDIEVKGPVEEGKRLQISLHHTLFGNLNSLIADIFSIPKSVSNGIESLRDYDLEETSTNSYPQPTPLRPGAPFPVCVSSVLEPRVVYLQRLNIDNPVSRDDMARNKELVNFLMLMQHLSTNAENFARVPNPIKGLACCAQYSYDNAWYRCVITEVLHDGVQVRYVDYGNSEIVPLHKLRQPDEYTLDFPIQAHLCKIKGIEPVSDEWTQPVSEALINKIFRSGSDIFAKLVNVSDINEIELLVKIGENQFELIYLDLIEKGLLKLTY